VTRLLLFRPREKSFKERQRKNPRKVSDENPGKFRRKSPQTLAETAVVGGSRMFTGYTLSEKIRLGILGVFLIPLRSILLAGAYSAPQQYV